MRSIAFIGDWGPIQGPLGLSLQTAESGETVIIAVSAPASHLGTPVGVVVGVGPSWDIKDVSRMNALEIKEVIAAAARPVTVQIRCADPDG